MITGPIDIPPIFFWVAIDAWPSVTPPEFPAHLTRTRMGTTGTQQIASSKFPANQVRKRYGARQNEMPIPINARVNPIGSESQVALESARWAVA
jgi:hypothetical protein